MTITPCLPNRIHPQATFARAVAEFERSGELPARPDIAELVLRGAILDVEAALLDHENDRGLRARQRLLEAARQTEDMPLQRQARLHLRLQAKGALLPRNATMNPRTTS